MSGKQPRLSPLELRKRMLIAESELNRARLLQEWASMSAQVRGFAGRANSFGSMAASAASLATGLFASRRDPPASPVGKPSWVEAGLKAMRLAGSIGLAFRAHGTRLKTR